MTGPHAIILASAGFFAAGLLVGWFGRAFRDVPMLAELDNRITAVEDRQHREWDR